MDASRAAQARENLEHVNLGQHVELRSQDAAITLADSSHASWEMIFLDAERSAYVDYWPDLFRVLLPGGLLVVDNVLSHASEVEEFRALVSNQTGVTEAVVPTGAGVLLIVNDCK